MRTRALVTTSLVSVAAVILAACSSSSSPSSAPSSSGVSTSPVSGTTSPTSSGNNGAGRTITVGVMNSFTGPFSASFPGTLQGIQARFDAYKASGGKCSGLTFKTVKGDDQSSAQGALTAAQQLAQQDKVFAILNDSALLFGATQYLTTTAKDIPVLGGGFDGGTQWRDKGNNLFAVPGIANYHNVPNTNGLYLKSIGATKVSLIGFDTPSSIASLEAEKIGDESVGLKIGYVNEKMPIGTTDIGAEVLGIKNSGADAALLSVTPPTAFAIAAGLKQAGVTMKSIESGTGYGADLLASPTTVQAGQGVSFLVSTTPTELHTKASDAQSDALKKYAGSKSGIPSFSQDEGWLAADLLIYALENVGCDGTQADIIKFLQTNSTYNAGGLMPSPVDFADPGAALGGCEYVVTLKGNDFVPDPKASPACGKPTGKNVAGF